MDTHSAHTACRCSKKHIKALLGMSPPTTSAEVRSLQSTATYSARFIPNLTSISAPLRSLTKRNAPWKWDQTEQKAFDAIKRGLQISTFISYFDPNMRSQLIVDASPVGLSATLVQSKDNVRRVISYASRSLTPVEQRYSQTEKEQILKG